MSSDLITFLLKAKHLFFISPEVRTREKAVNFNRKDLVIYKINNGEGWDRIRLPKGLNKRLPLGGTILRTILAGPEGHGFDEHSLSLPASGNLFDARIPCLFLPYTRCLQVYYCSSKSVCVCLPGQSHLPDMFVVLRAVIEVWRDRLL